MTPASATPDPAQGPPLFCITTPVFDPALPAVKLLHEALRRQSCGDWLHVLSSNGPSPEIGEWVSKAAARDGRLRLLELSAVATPDARSLFCDLGRRRDHSLRNVEAQRHLFFDADLALLRDDVLARLQEEHARGEPDVILMRSRGRRRLLPSHPVWKPGRIDVSNYCVSRRMAQAVRYPTDFHRLFPFANDFRYYHRLRRAARSWVELDLVAARVDGNASYVRLSEVKRRS